MTIDLSKFYLIEKRSLVKFLFYAGMILSFFASLRPWFLWSIHSYYPVFVSFLLFFAMLIDRTTSRPVFSRTDFLIPVAAYLLLGYYQGIVASQSLKGLISVAFLAFIFFACAAAENGQYFVASLAALSAGAGAGFWLYNRAPASIFMGDSGSHFLGYLLAVVSAKVTYYTPGVASMKFSLLIPLFILAIPLLDTLMVVAIRLHNSKPIYVGDHNHISHRFMHMGLTRPQAVTMVHLLALIAGLGALPLLWGDLRTCILLIVQGLLLFVLITYLQFVLVKKDSK